MFSDLRCMQILPMFLNALRNTSATFLMDRVFRRWMLGNLADDASVVCMGSSSLSSSLDCATFTVAWDRVFLVESNELNVIFKSSEPCSLNSSLRLTSTLIVGEECSRRGMLARNLRCFASGWMKSSSQGGKWHKALADKVMTCAWLTFTWLNTVGVPAANVIVDMPASIMWMNTLGSNIILFTVSLLLPSPSKQFCLNGHGAVRRLYLLSRRQQWGDITEMEI